MSPLRIDHTSYSRGTRLDLRLLPVVEPQILRLSAYRRRHNHPLHHDFDFCSEAPTAIVGLSLWLAIASFSARGLAHCGGVWGPHKAEMLPTYPMTRKSKAAFILPSVRLLYR
jgi:hypothetical protein